MRRGTLPGHILLVTVILACFLLPLAVHFGAVNVFIRPEAGQFIAKSSYYYPLHADEWGHLAAARAIADEHLISYNPYREEKMFDREIGFHLLLALLFIPGIDALWLFPLLPSFLLALNGLLLFILVRSITGNFWIGASSVVFFASIRNNINVLGNWFFVPFTFTLSLVFAFCIVCVLAFRSERQSPALWAIMAVLFAVSIFVYPLSAALMMLFFLVFLLLHPTHIRSRGKHIAGASAVMLASILAFLIFFFWTGTLSGTGSRLMSEIIFSKGWSSLEYSHSLLTLYGWLPLALAILGTYFIVFGRLKGLERSALFFPAIAVIFFLNMLMFVIFEASVGLPYQRNLYYFMVSLAPLSGAGLYYLCFQAKALSNKMFRHLTKRNRAAINSVLMVVLLLIVAIFTFAGYYSVSPEQFSVHEIVTPEEERILLSLKGTNLADEKLLANPFVSLAVYPISGNRVASVMDSSIEGRDIGAYRLFKSLGCHEKAGFAENLKIGLVLSDDSFQCPEFRLIDSEGGSHLYLFEGAGR